MTTILARDVSDADDYEIRMVLRPIGISDREITEIIETVTLINKEYARLRGLQGVPGVNP